MGGTCIGAGARVEKVGLVGGGQCLSHCRRRPRWSQSIRAMIRGVIFDSNCL